jgi:hypothetical protein
VLVVAGRAVLILTYLAVSGRAGRSAGPRELAAAVERGVGAGEHHLVDAVDVGEPGWMAFGGHLVRDLSHLGLAQT